MHPRWMMVSSVSVVVIDDKGNNSAILSKLHQKVLDVAWEVAAYTNLCFVFRGDNWDTHKAQNYILWKVLIANAPPANRNPMAWLCC